MNPIQSFIQTSLKNQSIQFLEEIQSLWSGYGSIERWQDPSGFSVIVKHIQFPSEQKHPKGWNSNIGHLRKVKSYEIENNWYKFYADQSKARVPKMLANGGVGKEQVIVLEDLNAAGFDKRVTQPNKQQYFNCISWLAQFHACFLNNDGHDLWEVGTYWNLGTRPEEFQVMPSGLLKDAASQIDDILNQSKYQTLVHGDAKMANFCFSENDEIAAVDFQYVGKGAGIKDLIYFISSVGEFETKEEESVVLDFYFDELAKFLGKRNKELETEWRGLYKYAWADFNRFLQGWNPGHWKLNNYVISITQEAIQGVMFNNLSSVAENAAKAAGAYILSRLGDNVTIRSKGDGLSLASSVVTEVDEASQSIILKHITPTLDDFDLGLLSEELKDDRSRFEKEFFWCIDPLDGTLPFTEQVSGYAVAISLVSKSGDPVIGVVYDPVKKTLYRAVKGEGAKKNNEFIKTKRSSNTFTFFTDRSLIKSPEYNGFLKDLKSRYLNDSITTLKVIAQGGAIMNALWILENTPGAYIKPPKETLGGGGLWDFSATACIFKELGFKATNYVGGKLDLNRLDSTFMNHEGVYFEVL